ncbi:MAG: ABC transporter ATP-binding protein [Patescibacteria group bacterium]
MNIIEVDNLKKYFGKTRAIDGISLDIKEGEIFGFLGPNGAGKTTTIRCMMDFIRPTGRKIKIFGKDAQKDSVELKKKIGYLSDNVYLYNKWTGKTHIDFVKHLNGKKDIADKLIKRLDFDPRPQVKKLSSGNRQKLGLILALMFEPELLIFNEPTASLDPLLQNTVYKLIKEATDRGTTVFMSSHNLAEVERVCSRVGIIKEGRMAAIENIASLKEKRIYTVRVYFADKFKKEEFLDDNVEIRKEVPAGLILGIKGDINKLIRKLSNYKLKDLAIEQASLEEIFLEFYKK